MPRKKWTPQIDITDSLLKFREKRKWQLALRRYVLDKNPSYAYAFYFGLGIEEFRKWIEIQFTEGLRWENFGSAWQFDHIVPVAYFDFSNEQDLLLCWNFINIRVEGIQADKNLGNRIDALAAKPYFEALHNKTGYSFCLKMISKISSIEGSNILNNQVIEDFIIQNKAHLEMIASLSKEEFSRLSMGISIKDILLEREIINKFG